MPTITRRFQAAGIVSTGESRRAYREMLVAAPGLAEYISGVILQDETIRQPGSDGTPFPQLLRQRGMLPGIKVDAGAKPLAGAAGEKVTEGLDGLRERIADYAGLGARFAKWRAVITVGEGIPSRACITANAHALARYAALCQEGGLVPIVEPEVLMDGGHTIERCEAVTEATLRTVFAELAGQRVVLEEIVLKPSMVVAGSECPRQASVEEVASATLRCLRRTVPAAVPGIAFLSGGQSPELATAHLAAINAAAASPGSSPSPTDGPCKTRPWQPGTEKQRPCRPACRRSTSGPGSTQRHGPAATRPKPAARHVRGVAAVCPDRSAPRQATRQRRASALRAGRWPHARGRNGDACSDVLRPAGLWVPKTYATR